MQRRCAHFLNDCWSPGVISHQNWKSLINISAAQIQNFSQLCIKNTAGRAHGRQILGLGAAKGSSRGNLSPNLVNNIVHTSVHSNFLIIWLMNRPDWQLCSNLKKKKKTSLGRLLRDSQDAQIEMAHKKPRSEKQTNVIGVKLCCLPKIMPTSIDNFNLASGVCLHESGSISHSLTTFYDMRSHTHTHTLTDTRSQTHTHTRAHTGSYSVISQTLAGQNYTCAERERGRNGETERNLIRWAAGLRPNDKQTQHVHKHLSSSDEI